MKQARQHIKFEIILKEKDKVSFFDNNYYMKNNGYGDDVFDSCNALLSFLISDGKIGYSLFNKFYRNNIGPIKSFGEIENEINLINREEYLEN